MQEETSQKVPLAERFKTNKNPAAARKVACIPHHCLNLHWKGESARGREVLAETPKELICVMEQSFFFFS